MARSRPTKPKPSDSPEPLLTTKQLCARLKITQPGLSKCKRKGLTPASKDPTTRGDLWRLSDVVAWRAVNLSSDGGKPDRGSTRRLIGTAPTPGPGSTRAPAPTAPAPEAGQQPQKPRSATRARPPSRGGNAMLDGFTVPTSVVEADLRLKTERAQMYHIQKLKLAGELVDAGAVRRAIARRVADARRVFDTIPRSASPRICAALKAPESAAPLVEAILRDIVKQAAEILAGSTPDAPDAPDAPEQGDPDAQA